MCSVVCEVSPTAPPLTSVTGEKQCRRRSLSKFLTSILFRPLDSTPLSGQRSGCTPGSMSSAATVYLRMMQRLWKTWHSTSSELHSPRSACSTWIRRRGSSIHLRMERQQRSSMPSNGWLPCVRTYLTAVRKSCNTKDSATLSEPTVRMVILTSNLYRALRTCR